MVVVLMKVFILLFTTLREIAGQKKVMLEYNSSTIGLKDVLEDLVERFGQEFRDYLFKDMHRVQEHLQLLVNGKSVDMMDELNTILKDNDEVAIEPPVGGG